MSTFELKDGQIVCKKCGSKNVSIKAGMMVDRAICHECGNKDYLRLRYILDLYCNWRRFLNIV